MCPLKREQARREMQQWVMRRLPTADSIVEIERKVDHELMSVQCYHSIHVVKLRYSKELEAKCQPTRNKSFQRITTRPSFYSHMKLNVVVGNRK